MTNIKAIFGLLLAAVAATDARAARTDGGFGRLDPGRSPMRSKSAPASRMTRRSSRDPFGVVFLPTGRALLVHLLAIVPRLRFKKPLFAIAAVAAAAGVVASVGLADATPRSGVLHVTKECSEYNGLAGAFCTITSSNIPQIKPGMRVVYLQPLGPNGLDSDIVLSKGHGSAAFGHVVLNATTSRVTLSGGRGAFTGFRADVQVSVDAAGVWYWDGTYSFTSGAGDEDD